MFERRLVIPSASPSRTSSGAAELRRDRLHSLTAWTPEALTDPAASVRSTIYHIALVTKFHLRSGKHHR
jgi:hypothetical protein